MKENNSSTKTKNKWNSIPLDEKEVLILVDYYERTITIYTSNQPTSTKLLKKLGEPTRKDYFEGLVASMEWKVSFDDREKIRKAMSLTNFVSLYQSKSNSSE
mgnify:CR=1 FL=1